MRGSVFFNFIPFPQHSTSASRNLVRKVTGSTAVTTPNRSNGNEKDETLSGMKAERIINISRLNERHRLIAEGKIPPVTYEWEKEKWGKRMRFGKYGIASGVSPSELWPTIQEVEEEESFQLYRPVSEVMREVKNNVEERKSMLQRRIEELAKNEDNYERRLKEYEASLKTVEKQKTEDEAKLEKRILEIQEYFGYRIDPKDPRFEVMFQQKEAEEKKAEKEAKRRAKLLKTVAAVTESS